MIKLHCEKNFKKLLTNFLNLLNVSAEISTSAEKSDVDISVNSDTSNLKHCIFAVIPSENIKRISNIGCKIITCGLSDKATVTLSSITETGGVFCLQRSIETLSGKKISPFEFPFEITGVLLDSVTASILLSVALVCDVPASMLEKIKL